MKLSGYVIRFLVIASTIFAIGGMWHMLVPWAPLEASSFFLGAAYCMVLAFLINLSQGSHRGLMLITALVVIPTVIIRLMTLLVSSETFGVAVSPLYYYLFRTDNINKALLYVILGTVSLWAGLGLGLPKRRPANPQELKETTGFSLYDYRRKLIVAGYIVLAIHFFLNLGLKEGVSALESGPYGYLLRLFPLEALLPLNMYFLLRYRCTLAHNERSAIMGFFFLMVVLGVLQGKRGAIFYPFMTWAVVGTLLFDDPKITLRRGMLLGFLFMLFIGLLWNVPWSIRSVWRDEESLTISTLLDTYAYFQSQGMLHTILQVSNRLAYFDELVIVMNYHPPGLEQYMNMRSLLSSIINTLTIDRLFHIETLSSSQIFAFFYQGMPLYLKHGAGWGGFGASYGYFKWWGIAALFALGFITATLRRLSSPDKELAFVVSILFTHRVYFNGLIGGTFDNALGEFVSNAVLVLALVLGCKIVGQSTKRETLQLGV